MDEKSEIRHVSDTALWVAHYRGVESDRSDALIRDPLAKILSGYRGEEIAKYMEATSKYTHWNVVMRTLIIDRYIQELVLQGVDTIINLGAGLDTRPYRLSLPKNIHWIEVDYPHMIEYKKKHLQSEKPRFELERISLDLSDREKRVELFSKLGQKSKNILIITEGVILYLDEDQVASLADDLSSEKKFKYWIAEYISPKVYRHFNTRHRMKKMKNAPFRFFPEDWFGFFQNHGWKQKDIQYLAEEGYKVGRSMPIPLWAKLSMPFASRREKDKHRRYMGYVIFTR